MSVLYCLNPECKRHKNSVKSRVCKSCGSNLILNKRYVAIKKIGRGGFGVTYLSIDLKNKNSYCVIKQLLTVDQDEKTARTALNLFEREAKTLKKINHPQIPQLLDYFEDSNQFYLIQEFVLGKDLEREVHEKGTFSETQAIEFLRGMLPVLQYIHSQKVIHRDIKPGNILRRKSNGDFVLIDFGAVKDSVKTQVMGAQPQNSPNKTNTAISVGTQGFAPPEQLAMRPVYASDIYALGSTCVYVLTGQAPHDLSDPTTGEVAWEEHTNVNSSFAKILNKMLALDLRKRYDSAMEIIKDLDMIPYAKDLKGAMLTARPKSDNIKNPPSLIDTDVSSPNTTQNLMEAIRKRKERRKNNPGQAVKPSSPMPAVKPPPKPKIKFTADLVLNEYSKGNRNFSQQNLSQLNLADSKLPGASFSKSKLIGVNLKSSNLVQTNFVSANLAQANLNQAKLQKAELYRANLKNADLQGADLQQANLTHAILKEANLRGANLTGAKVEEEQLKQAKTNWSTIYPNGKRRWW